MFENDDRKNEFEDDENKAIEAESNQESQEEIFAEPEIVEADIVEPEKTESEQGRDDGRSEGHAEKMSYRDIPEETPAQKVKHKKSMNTYVKVLCCAILFGAVAGGMILGSSAISKKVIAANTNIETNAAKLSTASSSDSNSSKEKSGSGYSVSQIASQCKSSVVAITNQSVSEVQSMFGVMQQESTSSGSGVIIGKNDTELLIVTNNHVVSGSESLTVCFNDSEDAVFNAQIKGTDTANDLAVIAIKLSDISEDILKSISIATIGDSSELEVGDEVVAIGNALGFGQSVTSGIVSAVDREVTIDETTATLLQTDAAINPGNSGGALFNMKGELIGINTAKYASEQIEGMGFAIPMAKAQSIIENLMKQETRDKLDSNYGFLNISGQDVDTSAAQMYGIPEGVYVTDVTDGGAAAKAGIQKSDIITALDGKAITGITQLKDELQYYKAGEKVKITIQRNSDGGYKEQTLTVTLDNASKQQSTGQNRKNNDSTDDSIQDYGNNGNGFGFGIN